MYTLIVFLYYFQEGHNFFNAYMFRMRLHPSSVHVTEPLGGVI